MGIQVDDVVDVQERAVALDLSPINGIGILPRGFETATTKGQLVQEEEASTIRKLLEEAGVEVRQVGLPESPTTLVQKSGEWVAPTLVVSSMLWSQNPYLVQVALGTIQSYVTDFLKIRLPQKGVKLVVIVDRGKGRGSKKITYEGPASGLKDLGDVIRRVYDE